MAPLPSASRLCLLADDLTGALDSAVWFASSATPVQVVWQSRPSASSSIAIDSGTREMPADAAAREVSQLVATFPAGGNACHFLKLDSLLRGHAAADLAAWHAARPFDHVVLAPAFPRQGRVTRGGRQYWRDGTEWVPTACDLAHEVATAGFAPALCRPGVAAPAGVSLWDSETDDDLRAVVAAGLRLSGEVLWCGCGGLAGALAEAFTGQTSTSEARPAFDAALARPVLGRFGTAHPVTHSQLAACDPALHVPPEVARVEAQWRAAGVALVRPALPAGLARAEAAARIAAAFAALVTHLAPPATLVVSGGETLHAVCRALGADRLDLIGQIAPGIPRSILRGGAWEGVGVVSKSGAFGEADTLTRLLADIPSSTQGSHA